MMINDLFRLVRTTDASLFDKQSVLKSFIQSRTNIFQSDPELSTEICNRSMDYREAMLCIVDELADTSRQRNVNFISSQLGLHYPTVKRCEIGLGVTADSEFVSEHKSILAFAGPTPVLANQRLIGLHPLSQTIPSVWVNETLPEYDPSTWRWDYSFTISETARVVHSIKDSSHLKLEIVDNSPYAYDTVHVRGADVGLKNENLLEWFPLHSLVRPIQ
uniref:Uncharacterized protein n=1 Tax=Plectus sambesii TaxID=2011161 RepID=A0A914V3W1_9BILA